MGFLKRFNINILILFIIFLSASWLRIENLGYSNYQGDEIRAFFNPSQDGGYLQFLLDQRKGPNQFILTGFLRDVTDNYQNYFLTRLPFALAGVLSILVFYLVVKNFFGTSVAVWSSLFFATNGFLVAFSRIVQYQAFVILFGLTGILLYQFYQKTKRYGFLYFSGVSFAISILFHYDGVFFAVPIVITGLWFLFKDFRIKNSVKDKKVLKHHLFALTLTSLILLSFYIPFVLNISDETLKYWKGRVTGSEYSKISSSYYLFTVYQPFYAIQIYIITTFLGLVSIMIPFVLNKIKKSNTKFVLQCPSLIGDNITLTALLIWGILPLSILEVFVNIPGTHIYTYLIPGMILMALGINFLFELIRLNLGKIFSNVFIFVSILVFIFLTLQSHTIFVDYKQGEYPWESKKFMNFELKPPLFQDFHLSLFGFPYNRNWDDISKFMSDKPGFYQTNERSVISNYYLKKNKRSKNLKFYVFIEKPQSFINQIDNLKTKSYLKKITPIYTSTNINGNKSVIYYIPETLENLDSTEKDTTDE